MIKLQKRGGGEDNLLLMQTQNTLEKKNTTLFIVIGIFLLTELVLGITKVTLSLPVLLDAFVPDDAFYYHQTAYNFSKTLFSSFDGLHYTNGYHPLWFLVSAGTHFVFQQSGETPFRFLLLLQVLFSMIASGGIIIIAYRLAGIAPAVLTGFIWLLGFQEYMVNGLETALLMMLYVITLNIYLTFSKKSNLPSPRTFFLLGLLGSLVFLARTEMGFLVLALSAAIVLDARLRQPNVTKKLILYRLAAYSLPLILICGYYLLSNYLATGHISQVSGAVKEYNSEIMRARAISQTGNALQVYWDNLAWAFTNPNKWFIAGGVLLPWILLGMGYRRKREHLFPSLIKLLPFFLASSAAYLYYGLVFYSVYTTKSWYYSTQILWCGLALACVVGEIIQWLHRKLSPHLLRLHRKIILLISGLLLLSSFFVVIGYEFFIHKQTFITLAGAASVILTGWFIQMTAGKKISAAAGGILALFLVFSPVQDVLKSFNRTPLYWNYNLYLGALWVRDNLPPDAKVWAPDAGIMGYFSRHIVVNTDGLANSYDYLENVLKPNKANDYIKQWDYAAFVLPINDRWFLKYFPEGCYVPLPEEILQYPFQLKSLTYRIAVYQMVPMGMVDCQKIEQETQTDSTP
jgi:hypothetical protein